MSSLPPGHGRGVFFDLDGTLVDTALDMVRVLQALQRDLGVEPVPYRLGRTQVSNGAAGLLRVGFPDLDEEARNPLLCEFVQRYSKSVAERSVLFDGMEPLLRELEAASIPWGVVTNKPGWLTDDLLEQLGLATRMACAVGGDTLPVRKPHPEPLLHACRLAGCLPDRSVYVGDHARDIEAGNAAGMQTIGVTYGYLAEDDDPGLWGASMLAASTGELATIVRKAVNLVS